MRAVILKHIGKIEEIKKNLIIEELPKPVIKDDDVLIKIKYAALNHRDLWITKGLYAGIKLPVVLGSDCSGIIEEKGRNVAGLKIGDEVVVNPGLNWGDDELHQGKNFRILGLPDNGTLGEFIAINKSNVFKKPVHLRPEEAAAIPLAGLTAYRATFVKGELCKGKKVLVTGIGGGVSTFALLYSINCNAKVYVTSGKEDKIEKAIELGAKGGINYKNENWDKEILEISKGGFDLIIDGTGGETISKCLNVINSGGRIVNYGATTGNTNNFEIRKIFWKQVSLLGTTMGSDRDFKNMIDFISHKKITPVTDKVYDIENVCDAFIRMDKSEQLGKIVVKVS
ncbi:MAG: zinc-binding dehydrogenase [Ignavibacteria bacterium]|jgi:NADPH:quinone reductase-like Zn-dependent oxidoreductase